MDDDVRCHVAECKEIISEKVSKEAKAINTIIVISSTLLCYNYQFNRYLSLIMCIYPYHSEFCLSKKSTEVYMYLGHMLRNYSSPVLSGYE